MRSPAGSAPLLLCAMSLAVPLAAPPAAARTWRVNVAGTGDAPTIQAAVDSAGPGDEIVVAPGTYAWTQQGHTGDYGMIFFDRFVGGFALRSEAGPDVTILDAEWRGRIMFIMAENDVTIEGFTFYRGKAPPNYDSGGGLIGHLSAPAIRNCVFRGNTAHNGGGLWYGGVSAPLIEGCAFIDNSADNGGGVCFVNSSTAARLVGCLIEGNSAADRGGGIFVYNYPVLLEGCTIADNGADRFGGGLCLESAYPSTLERCTLADNSAPEGGGLLCKYGSELSLFGCVIAWTRQGGALGMDEGSILVVGCSLLHANSGGDSLPARATDAGSNYALDPQFCGVRGSRNWTVQADSPCLPANHPDGIDCQLIGAWPAGCGTVGIEPASWGSLKRRAR